VKSLTVLMCEFDTMS